MNNKMKILVCTHKPGFVLQDDIYTPIQVGKALSNVDLGFLGDDKGDNISVKNKEFCELTAMYWAWKNLKNLDVIGLCHYRRYFDLNASFLSVSCRLWVCWRCYTLMIFPKKISKIQISKPQIDE